MTISPAIPAGFSDAPTAFHLLVKPSGSACNLDCAYCFLLDSEPTLIGLGFFRRAMALAEKYRRPGVRFLHTMQTNEDDNRADPARP